MLLLKLASAYLRNPARAKGEFLSMPFYSATDKFVKALHASFNDIQIFNKRLFLDDGLNGFLAEDVMLSRTVEESFAQIFVNNMKLFGHGSGDFLEST